MRIISGKAGGVPIKVPKTVTRPTADRVRQAVFSMLSPLIDGSRVLDLFAGSGSLGMECLSRGARDVVFIDQNAGACGVIRENLQKTRLGPGSVRQGDVFRMIEALVKSGERFDLILADPPYAHDPGDPDFASKLLLDPRLPHLLAADGSVLVECRVTKGGIDSWSSLWDVERDREYGSTRILWVRPRSSHVDDTPPQPALL